MSFAKLIRKSGLLPSKWMGQTLGDDGDPLEEEETTDPAWYHRLLSSRLNFFSNITSQSTANGIPPSILAFRLITKTLALIPRSSEEHISAVDNFANSKAQATWTTNERRELRVSNAFAHLAVAEHDVVAISTNHAAFQRTTQSLTPHANQPLGVMACSTLQSGNIENPTDANSPGILYRIYDVLFARNDQKSGPKVPVPTIVSPKEPADFKPDDGLLAYMKRLETKWYLHSFHPMARHAHVCCRQEPTLPGHLWILSQLLAYRSDSLNAISSMDDLKSTACPQIRFYQRAIQTSLQIHALFLLPKDGPTTSVRPIEVLLRSPCSIGQIYFQAKQTNSGGKQLSTRGQYPERFQLPLLPIGDNLQIEIEGTGTGHNPKYPTTRQGCVFSEQGRRLLSR